MCIPTSPNDRAAVDRCVGDHDDGSVRPLARAGAHPVIRCNGAAVTAALLVGAVGAAAARVGVGVQAFHAVVVELGAIARPCLGQGRAAGPVRDHAGATISCVGGIPDVGRCRAGGIDGCASGIAADNVGRVVSCVFGGAVCVLTIIRFIEKAGCSGWLYSGSSSGGSLRRRRHCGGVPRCVGGVSRCAQR